MERIAEAVIVPAGPGDAAALADVHVRSWRETYEGLLPAVYLDRMSVQTHARRWRHHLTHAAAGEVVLAVEGPRGLIGYCTGALHPLEGARRQGEIITLYLLNSAQGLGLGRRLMEMTARALQAQGASSLIIWALSGNDRAGRFYEHMGGGVAAQRDVKGWGGGLKETAYYWSDIAIVTGA
jgi:ribosomal protein S18 acetylase RimI-like enzyme